MFGFFKTKNTKKLEEISGKIRATGMNLANEAIERQRSLVLEKSLTDIEGARLVTLVTTDETSFGQIERQFMWGWFNQYVAETDFLPTKGAHRTSVHIAEYLTSRYGLTWQTSLAEARRLDKLYNMADETFDLISELGRQAYLHPDEPYLFQALKVIGEIQLSNR